MLILYSEDPLKSEIGLIYCFISSIKVSKDSSKFCLQDAFESKQWIAEQIAIRN